MADFRVKGKIEIDTSDSKQKTEETRDGFKGLHDTLNKNTKAAKEGGGAFSGLSSILKGLGVVSLVDAAFNVFKETLGKNQKVADLMTTSMNFLKKVFNDLIEFLSNNIGSVVEWFKQIFENPVESLKSFGDAIKNNLIERFNSFLETIGYLGTALKSLFSGDFKGAVDAVKDAGKEMLDVLTGVDDSANKIGKVIDKVVDYTTKTWKAAEAQTALANTAKLSAAQLQGLIEEYDRLAEIQRQIRDDESISIEERIAANNKLGQILQDQQKAMIALANQKIAAAKADLDANKGSVEMQVAYTEALNERKAILAQVTGLESEQKVNAVALAKEQLQMNQALLESENAITFEKKKAAAELIINERIKLDELKKISDEEREIELARLQNNINATNEGTQARIDALIAYNEKKSEYDIAEIEYIKQLGDLTVKSLEDQKAIDAAKLQSQIQFAQGVGQVFSQLSGMFEQGTAASKVAALADIAIGTGTGFINALDIAQKSSKATGPAAAFAFPIFYATQIAAVLGAAARAKNILSQVRGGGSGISASAPPNVASPISPQQVSTTLSGQTIQNIGNAAAGGVARSYVLQEDINNSQERQARLQRAARLN